MKEPICPYCGDGPQSVGTQNHIECVAALMAERDEANMFLRLADNLNEARKRDIDALRKDYKHLLKSNRDLRSRLAEVEKERDELRGRMDDDCADCATGIERYRRERLEDSLDEEREKNRQLHEQIVELIMRAERAEKGAEQASQAKPRVHCKQCRYWDCEETTDRGYRLGTCHYNPPTVCVLGNRVLEMPSYPATYGYEWCGRGEKGENRDVECD